MNTSHQLLEAADAVARFIGGEKDRLGRPDQCASAAMSKARADVLALARHYDVAGGHGTILDQCAAVLRAASEADEKPAPGAGSKRMAYLREVDQFGAHVFHPDCDTSRNFIATLGNKNVTWKAIELLKVAGYEVRVRGSNERSL